MDNWKAELVALVGQKNVLDDPETLNKYSRDQSFTEAMKPEKCFAKLIASVLFVIRWVASSTDIAIS